jgi:hypothetical protein
MLFWKYCRKGYKPEPNSNRRTWPKSYSTVYVSRSNLVIEGSLFYHLGLY